MCALNQILLFDISNIIEEKTPTNPMLSELATLALKTHECDSKTQLCLRAVKINKRKFGARENSPNCRLSELATLALIKPGIQTKKQKQSQILNHAPHGNGKMTCLDGAIYEGEFRNGLLHGKGKMTTSDGRTYEGEFQNNLPHGQGRATLIDGTTYEGEFLNGLVHGKGKQTEPNGQVYEGEFLNGCFQG